MTATGADPWQTLCRGGLPLAGRQPGETPTADALAAAVRVAQAETGARETREADALCAFLLAWRHHWPSSFARAFGRDAESLASWASSYGSDPNRILKLRRIAIANLSEVL